MNTPIFWSDKVASNTFFGYSKTRKIISTTKQDQKVIILHLG